MTTTPQTGANWKAGGELEALHRIVKPVIADDEPEEALSAPPPIGDNSRRHEISADDALIETLAEAVDRALTNADEAQGRAKSSSLRCGTALDELHTSWLAREQKKKDDQTAEMQRLREDGRSGREIDRLLGVQFGTASKRLRALRGGRGTALNVLEKVAFWDWAATRFSRPKINLQGYLYQALNPEKVRAQHSAVYEKHRSFVALGRLTQEKGEALVVFKKALPSLSTPDEFALLRAQASRLIPRLGRKDRQEFRELVEELMALQVAKA